VRGFAQNKLIISTFSRDPKAEFETKFEIHCVKYSKTNIYSIEDTAERLSFK